MVTQSTASLPEIHQSFREWLNDTIRLDRWSLDAPTVIATEIGGNFYPANTAMTLPAQQIRFERTTMGILCTATLRFQIKYRFSKALNFDALPITDGEAVVNNLYFIAVEYPAEINDSIRKIVTPDNGVDVAVARVEDTTDSDWLLILNPDFQVTFNAALADLSGVQPVEEDPVIVRKLDIAIYRGEIGFDPEVPETYRLDRQFSVD